MSEWLEARFDALVHIGEGQVDPRVEPYRSMVHIGPDNIESGTGRLSELRTAAELNLVSGKYLFDEEAILYSKIRPNLNKVARPQRKGLCSADVYPLWVDGEVITSAYLHLYMLMAPAFLYEVTSRSNRTGLPKVNREELGSIRIRFPRNLAHQQRVADALLTWDEAIEKTQRLLSAKRNEMVGTFLSAAGRTSGNTARIGDMCDILRGQGLSKDDLSPNGAHPCILYGELHTTYREVVTDVRSKTDAFTPTHSQRGDVLVPSSSETSEDFANATSLKQAGVLLGGDINILRPKHSDEYNADYLAYYLTHAKRREIACLAQGNAVVHLYGRDIAQLGVALPGIERQRCIASALAYGRRGIAALEGVRDRYLMQRRGVAQTLFGGITPAAGVRQSGRES